MRYFFILSLFCCWLPNSLTIAQTSPKQDLVDFNRDVRPILSDNCYACHGPDEAQRQTDWRLDEPLPADGDIVRSGKPNDSELVFRILSDDPDLVMPPEDHRKKLTAVQKQTLVRWIEQGADWQDQWALRKPKPSSPPPVPADRAAANFIDNYVLKQISESGLEPSGQADRKTLIRRLYFDIVGMPPTFEEANAFINDDSDDAYESAVDRLLASPHFGERMAIYWLDLVRYADSVGYHGDQEISASPFRDYVIQAFNTNMPFDQFTREQLAGDLLENPTRDQLVASGYNRLGMMSAEGGVQPKEYLAKYASERVRTTSTVWLGMTLGCAECHDHKFDPFSIEDFYNFASFFADIKERGLYDGANTTGKFGPTISIPDENLEALLKPFDKRLEKFSAQLAAETPELSALQKRWEAKIATPSATWSTMKPIKFNSYSETTFEARDDNSILITGNTVPEDTYLIALELPENQIIRALRLEVLPDKSLPKKGPGRAGNGNFVVTELLAAKGELTSELEVLKKVHELWPEDFASKRIEMYKPTASFEQASSANDNPYGKWAAESAIDQDKKGPTWGWAINPESGKPNEMVVQFQEPIDTTVTPIITLTIQQYHGTNHTLGCFRISVTKDEDAAVDWQRRIPADMFAIIATSEDQRTDEQQIQLRQYFRSVAPELESVRNQIATTTNEREKLVAAKTRTSPITVSVPPREMRVLARGNWMDDSGALAEPQVPSVLSQIKKEGRATRLDLADWVLDPENPLTARVYVNRLWKLFFDTGLSKVLDDMGSQGEAPSHSELLDALAIKFVENGWDTKQVIKLIVMSNTYQQSSTTRDEWDEMDPYNRLLARQSRFRLDAEMIRDNALAVSGLLVKDIGGRSAKPYQPEGLYRHLNFPQRKYRADVDKNQYRRGLYTHWQRQFLHPAMKTFDAPSREECTCQRPRSNTPLAALVLLNDPSYIEAARSFATHAIENNETTHGRIEWMMKQALSRMPNDAEQSVLTELYTSHLKQFSTDEDAAKQLVEVGLSEAPKKIAVAELAAWTSVARTIMNLHEFIMRN